MKIGMFFFGGGAVKSKDNSGSGFSGLSSLLICFRILNCFVFMQNHELKGKKKGNVKICTYSRFGT